MIDSTGSKNKYHKPMILTGADSGSGDLIIKANISSNTVFGYNSMYNTTTGSNNTCIGTNAGSWPNPCMTEEQAIEHMNTINTNVLLKDNVKVTVTIYEFMKIKNLVEDENKKLSELTKEDFDVYLLTIRM